MKLVAVAQATLVLVVFLAGHIVKHCGVCDSGTDTCFAYCGSVLAGPIVEHCDVCGRGIGSRDA